MKILFYGDYTSATGFSTVLSNIARNLPEDYELDVVAINYFGRPGYDEERFPGRLWPALHPSAPTDHLGRRTLIERINQEKYDLLLINQDAFVFASYADALSAAKKANNPELKVVLYFPIDAYPRMSWLKAAQKADHLVVYTPGSRQMILDLTPWLDQKLSVIPHGINLDEFYIVNEGEAKSFKLGYFGSLLEDKWLLVNVNRNQARKDLPRSLIVLKYLLQKNFPTCLYLHCADEDIGNNLSLVGKDLGLKLGVDFFLPDNFKSNGVTVGTLNMIYNAADMTITTTRGEGWGFSIVESFATRTPVCGPGHSAVAELLAEGRGILAQAGNSPSLWSVMPDDNNLLRPLIDVEDMGKKIMSWFKDWDSSILDNAEKFAVEHEWRKVVKEMWVPLFEKLVNSEQLVEA